MTTIITALEIVFILMSSIPAVENCRALKNPHSCQKEDQIQHQQDPRYPKYKSFIHQKQACCLAKNQGQNREGKHSRDLLYCPEIVDPGRAHHRTTNPKRVEQRANHQNRQQPAQIKKPGGDRGVWDPQQQAKGKHQTAPLVASTAGITPASPFPNNSTMALTAAARSGSSKMGGVI